MERSSPAGRMECKGLLSSTTPRMPPLASVHAQHERARTVCLAEQRSVTEIRKAETYLGEKFTKTVPKARNSWENEEVDSGSITVQHLDHCAVEVTDVDKSIRFYTNVLGFKRLARPGFPFGGAWLSAGGLTLHLIEKDPSVERNVESGEGVFSHFPEPWYIRRSEHKGKAYSLTFGQQTKSFNGGKEASEQYHELVVLILAFSLVPPDNHTYVQFTGVEVADLEAAEERLKCAGVEFHKFLVPGTSAAQLFLFDPDFNGIELGAHYGDVAALLEHKEFQ